MDDAEAVRQCPSTNPGWFDSITRPPAEVPAAAMVIVLGWLAGDPLAISASTLALVVALLSFVNLAGLEKAILAIVLGIRALSPNPQPALDERRNWARTAAVLGAAHIILVVTIILMNLDRLSKVIDALRALSDLK